MLAKITGPASMNVPGLNWVGKALDANDRSVELHLILGAVATLSFVGVMIFHAIAHAQFDPIGSGTGLAGVFTGTGAAAWGQGLGRKAQDAA